MAAIWHTCIIRAGSEEEAERFRQLQSMIGALPAARELGLDIQEHTLRTAPGNSIGLRRELHTRCITNSAIVWCTLTGPRGVYYNIMGDRYKVRR